MKIEGWPIGPDERELYLEWAMTVMDGYTILGFRDWLAHIEDDTYEEIGDR